MIASAQEVKVLVEGLAFPEGPAFAPDGALWWVEIEAGCLGRWSDGRADRIAIGGRPNGLAFDAAGDLWICDQGLCALRRHDPAQGTTETVAEAVDGQRLGKPNDLAFDAAANLVFTCSNGARSEPLGYVCCLTPDGALTRIADGLYFPNGIAFNADGRLIVAETYRQRLWSGAWDPAERIWREPGVLAETRGPIGPDGLAVAEGGNVFAAVFGQGAVVVLRPDGAPDEIIAVPDARPTNLAFDPSGRLGLVVTGAERGCLLAFPHITRRPVL